MANYSLVLSIIMHFSHSIFVLVFLFSCLILFLSLSSLKFTKSFLEMTSFAPFLLRYAFVCVHERLQNNYTDYQVHLKRAVIL